MKHPLRFALTTYTLLVASSATAQENAKETPPEEVVQENQLDLCQDGVDNDRDSHVDCADQDCQVFVLCAEGKSADSPDATASEEEETIGLDSLEEEETSAGPPGHPHGGHGEGAHMGGNPKMPKLKLFFDLLIEYEWETALFQFTRDHAHVMLELTATDWLSFRADIALEPEFFEGMFQLGKAAELIRGGDSISALHVP